MWESNSYYEFSYHEKQLLGNYSNQLSLVQFVYL